MNIVHTNFVTSSQVFVYYVTGLYIDVVCNSVLHTIFTIYIFFSFSNLNLSRIKRTTVEISVLILSCVILGLNPVLPVLHIYIFLNHDL